jgi:hypothetical protein
MDTLTKALVGLYEEPDRPTQPLDYLKRYLGAPANIDVDGLKRENEELKRQVEKLKRQLLEK